MQSRILILLLLILALAACDAAPRAYDAGTSAIFARQTSDAAGSDANAFEVIAQGERARKTEAAREREQQNAHEMEMQSARQTAEPFEAQRADLQKTEDARDRASALTTREAAAQKTATAAAQQTTTRVAEGIAQQTSVAVVAAANVKATLQAEQLQDEVAKRTEQRQIQTATLDARKKASYVSEFIGTIWLPVASLAVLIVFMFGIVLTFRTLIMRMNAVSVSLLPPPVVITDRFGNPIGFIKPIPNGGYIQESFRDMPLLDAPRQIEQSSALQRIEQVDAEEANSPEMIRINTLGGSTYITHDTPEEAEFKTKKQLALRLLRDAINYHAHRQVDPRSVVRIPGYRDLDWSADTWNRAVALLKPFVFTKSGRGGGTFCGGEYPSLVRMYDAVGANKIITPPAALAEISPSPANARVAA